jgi:hypothetical protein
MSTPLIARYNHGDPIVASMATAGTGATVAGVYHDLGPATSPPARRRVGRPALSLATDDLMRLALRGGGTDEAVAQRYCTLACAQVGLAPAAARALMLALGGSAHVARGPVSVLMTNTKREIAIAQRVRHHPKR